MTNPEARLSFGKLLPSLIAFLRHNINQVFAGKFIYFVLLSIVIFLTAIIIYVLDESAPPSAEAIYYFLLTPGTLLLFYPSCYALQADVDSRMLETIFGIPDYRFKVWLVRHLTQYLVIAALLTALGLFSQAALADFDLLPMIFHLMFPILFLGSVGLLLATLTRSGNGTAAIMVMLILAFWIAAEPLDGSRWDLFHNPFADVDAYEIILWQDTTLYNRIYQLVGSILATMMALLRLQKRERFV